MQQISNPYLDFGKDLIAKHSGLGYYYDSLSLIHPEYEDESEEKVWENKNYITNVTQLNYLKEYNNIYQKNLTFLTEVMEKKVVNQIMPSFEIKIEKRISELLPEVEKEITKKVTEQYLLSLTNTEEENITIFKNILKDNHVDVQIEEQKIVQNIRNIENYKNSNLSEFHNTIKQIANHYPNYHKVIQNSINEQNIKQIDLENITNVKFDLTSQNLEMLKSLSMMHNTELVQNNTNQVILHNEIENKQIDLENITNVKFDLTSQNLEMLKSLSMMHNTELVQNNTNQVILHNEIENKQTVINKPQNTNIVRKSQISRSESSTKIFNEIIQKHLTNLNHDYTQLNVIERKNERFDPTVMVHAQSEENLNESTDSQISNAQTKEYTNESLPKKEAGVKEKADKTIEGDVLPKNVDMPKASETLINKPTVQKQADSSLQKESVLQNKEPQNSKTNSSNEVVLVSEEQKNIIKKYANLIYQDFRKNISVDQHFYAKSQNVQNMIEKQLINYMNGDVTYNEAVTYINETVNQMNQTIYSPLKEQHKTTFFWVMEKNKPDKMLKKELPIEKLVNLSLTQNILSEVSDPVTLEHMIEIQDKNESGSRVIKDAINGNLASNVANRNEIRNVESDRGTMIHQSGANVDAKDSETKQTQGSASRDVTFIERREKVVNHLLREYGLKNPNLLKNETVQSINHISVEENNKTKKYYNYNSWIANNVHNYKSNMNFLQDIHLQKSSPLTVQQQSAAITNLIFLMEDEKLGITSEQSVKKGMIKNLQKEANASRVANRTIQDIIIHSSNRVIQVDGGTIRIGNGSSGQPLPVEQRKMPIGNDVLELVYETPPTRMEEKIKEKQEQEIIAQIEEETTQSVIKDIEFVRETEKIVQEKVTETIEEKRKTGSEMVFDVNTKAGQLVMEQIEKALDNKLESNINQIANKVYRNLEDRLRSERNRRGI